MAKSNGSTEALPDGAFDWSGGVDSSRVTTIQSTLNPNGLPRNCLSWLYNGTVRNGGIIQRTGWQPLLKIASQGFWQGGFIYEPDDGLPYLICLISGIPFAVQLVSPYSVVDLSGGDPLLRHPSDPTRAEMAFFVQGENWLIIQAGDYFNPGPVNPPVTDGLGRTLPLFWDGGSLRRSIGLTTPTPTMTPGQNEIPAAMCMAYHWQHIWYAQARNYSAGDMVGGPSGTAGNHYRDSILSVTENPLCAGGDGFTVPTNAGNIRALRGAVNINDALGQGPLYIWTRKSVYSLTVPTTRTDWIEATSTNQPLQTVIQFVNGSVGDRCVVGINGDWFYQSFEPAIRSLITAIRYYSQWGNTPISQNENRALEVNDRGLMRFSSGIEWNNRLWQLVLPEIAADGQNIIHKAVLPLDFDVVSNLAKTRAEANDPVWEGAYNGLDMLQVFAGDFGGLPRAFTAMISEDDGSLGVWELTNASRTENGDNRVPWGAEWPAFTWATSGLEFRLKQLYGGECWIDHVSGTVEMDVFYRPDADPCWRPWFHTEFCAARNCEEKTPVTFCYPDIAFKEGYRWPVVFPQPPTACDSMGVRPSTIGYQFQTMILLKGWCRIRGLILYALPYEKAQFQGIACPTAQIPQGMAKLPDPFST